MISPDSNKDTPALGKINLSSYKNKHDIDTHSIMENIFLNTNLNEEENSKVQKNNSNYKNNFSSYSINSKSRSTIIAKNNFNSTAFSRLDSNITKIELERTISKISKDTRLEKTRKNLDITKILPLTYGKIKLM